MVAMAGSYRRGERGAYASSNARVPPMACPANRLKDDAVPSVYLLLASDSGNSSCRAAHRCADTRSESARRTFPVTSRRGGFHPILTTLDRSSPERAPSTRSPSRMTACRFSASYAALL